MRFFVHGINSAFYNKSTMDIGLFLLDQPSHGGILAKLEDSCQLKHGSRLWSAISYLLSKAQISVLSAYIIQRSFHVFPSQ